MYFIHLFSIYGLHGKKKKLGIQLYKIIMIIYMIFFSYQCNICYLRIGNVNIMYNSIDTQS